MKFCYLLVLLVSILTTSFSEEVKTDPNNLLAQMEMAVCSNQTQITEAQFTSIVTKCPCDKQKTSDDIIKTCLKIQTDLTNSQRLTAICGPEKKCIVDAFAAKMKPEEMAASLKQRVACIKTEVGKIK